MTVTRGGERVDRYVAAALADLSRTAVQRLIVSGAITVNGGGVQVSYKVQAGDEISVSVPAPVGCAGSDPAGGPVRGSGYAGDLQGAGDGSTPWGRAQ